MESGVHSGSGCTSRWQVVSLVNITLTFDEDIQVASTLAAILFQYLARLATAPLSCVQLAKLPGAQRRKRFASSADSAGWAGLDCRNGFDHLERRSNHRALLKSAPLESVQFLPWLEHADRLARFMAD